MATPASHRIIIIIIPIQAIASAPSAKGSVYAKRLEHPTMRKEQHQQTNSNQRIYPHSNWLASLPDKPHSTAQPHHRLFLTHQLGSQATPPGKGVPHTATSPVHACAAASAPQPCRHCCHLHHTTPLRSCQPPLKHHCALCYCHGGGGAVHQPCVLLCLLQQELYDPAALHAHARGRDLAPKESLNHADGLLQAAALLLVQVLCKQQCVLLSCRSHAVLLLCRLSLLA
ncbi:hypothetical protein COO60DRAFT_177553 [Scenedesmus sp. NREL 46B-D3]|nr:hypothetical protein COO60DRAFT_177553 [Scenedesmus sp. NREL 46B-D3]